MKAADLGDLDDPTTHRRLDLPGLRCLLRQRQVGAASVVVGEVVGEVLAQDPQQVPFVDDDHVVEALPADAANQTFAVRVLPGRPCGGHDLLDSRRLDDLREVITVDPVAIADEESRRGIPWERVPDLLSGPNGRWMLGGVDVEDAAAVVREDDEDEEDEEDAEGGTVKKSTATICSTWLSRNVRQVGEGGLRRRGMYLATAA